jgi:tRNA pseudouridine13 synthase
LDGDGIRVLEVSRHNNKLRPGHLKGNRFRVLVREPLTPGPSSARGEGRKTNALAILDVIQRDGMPNFYGPQRFGRDGETGRLGMAMLRGQSAVRVNSFLRKLALSAAQSVLFNNCLARRMADKLFRTVIDGDVMAKWPAGGMFVSTEAAIDQARFDSREIVSTGPMFGVKMFASGGLAAEREAAILKDAELSVEAFRGFGSLLQGTRRHNLVYVDDLSCNEETDGLRLTFSLPAGSYATVLLREVMKTPLDAIE